MRANKYEQALGRVSNDRPMEERQDNRQDNDGDHNVAMVASLAFAQLTK